METAGQAVQHWKTLKWRTCCRCRYANAVSNDVVLLKLFLRDLRAGIPQQALVNLLLATDRCVEFDAQVLQLSHVSARQDLPLKCVQIEISRQLVAVHDVTLLLISS